jgi:hypothetical protein
VGKELEVAKLLLLLLQGVLRGAIGATAGPGVGVVGREGVVVPNLWKPAGR